MQHGTMQHRPHNPTCIHTEKISTLVGSPPRSNTVQHGPMVPRTPYSPIVRTSKCGNFRWSRLPTPIVQHRPHSPHSDNLNTTRLPTPLCNMQHATKMSCIMQHATWYHATCNMVP